jgi:hypothetical protein
MLSMSSHMDPPFAIKRRDGRLARLVEILLGVWMFASPVLFTHTPEQAVSFMVVGVLIVVFGLASLFVVPQARYVTAALGVWLVISAFVLPMSTDDTMWNCILGGLAALGLASVPNEGEPAWLERVHLRRHATA